MKRISLMVVCAVATSALAGGLTAYLVTKTAVKQEFVALEKSESPSGTHFTAYEKENYPDLTYAAENAVKAVVNIENFQDVRARTSGGYDPFLELFGIPQESIEQQQGKNPAQPERRSGGSGVIISADGYIVTNNHVIASATKIKVRLNDNRTYEAKLIGTDPATDIALIKIDEKDLPTLPFGDSDALRLGEWVLAIGSPFDLQSTVTAGIVSAKARNLEVIPNQFRVESFIQTDAAVNPGNSGGALVNTAGALVGINTVIKSPTGSFAGYSFAVPVSIVKKIVVDLQEYGVVQRGMLGISFQEVNAEFVEKYGAERGIKENGGLYVADMDPEGAAKAAGIKQGDIITQIDEVKIESTPQLLEQIAKHRPNEKVKVYVKRGDQTKQFDVVLRNKVGKAELLKRDYVDAVESLGGKFEEIDDKAKKDLGIAGGVRVVALDEKGILGQARVRKGYIITHINDQPIKSINDLSRITSKITTIDGVYSDKRSASYSLVR